MPCAARCLYVLGILVLFLGVSAARGEDGAATSASVMPPPAPFLAPRTFSWNALREPEALFWPGYFWNWNGPLEPDRLRSQLADMAAHDARSVCVLPLPHEFRPDSTNNQMTPDYLTEAFFDRIKLAVEEAARLGMNYWLYDEGGWPSGQAAGRVLRDDPESAVRVLARNSDGAWLPRREGMVDLLRPRTSQTFLALTHERYAKAVGSHFGKTIKLVFTDEPAYRRAEPGRAIPWPEGADVDFRAGFGYDARSKLDAFESVAPRALTRDQQRVRIDLFDFWSGRFRDAYFQRLRDWSRNHGLAHGGHLGGEDELVGAVQHGFGHVMRPLLAMDVPGVDMIWRQVFPGQSNHHFPKFASSAAHQTGSALSFTEAFCVYGNGLTPAQMKWITDYQRVRGLTLLVGGCYPLSTRDHHMTGERPHFGPVDPLWDFLPAFHRDTARIGYVLACGRPVIETALYYPVRDIWATGDPSNAALQGHDRLAQALLSRPCDFDVIDDDGICAPATTIRDGRLQVGPMRYRTLVVGPTEWMTEESRRRLAELEAAGGQVLRVDDLSRVEEMVGRLKPTLALQPPAPGIRVQVREWPGGGACFLFNEGAERYHGTVAIAVNGPIYEIEPATGAAHPMAVGRDGEGRQAVSVTLDAGASLLLVAHSQGEPPGPLTTVVREFDDAYDLSTGWDARIDRQYRAGLHDFEIEERAAGGFQPATLGSWSTTPELGPDFSGHVSYRRIVALPETFLGRRLVLDLGVVEYAARIWIDDREVGSVLWNPARIELPADAVKARFTLRVDVSNTLANELTSPRVVEAWSRRKGAGWPSPYHARALTFEKDSRGGGLLGPVRLRRGAAPRASRPTSSSPR